jgi:hypothetical protein
MYINDTANFASTGYNKCKCVFTWFVLQVNFQFASVKLLKNFLIMLLSAHWGACAWALLSQLENTEDATWVTSFFGEDACRAAYPHIANGYYWKDCHTPSLLYTISVYWSVMTLTSIGYG